jgi:hypothetical protein
LDIAEAVVVEDFELSAVGFGNVGEVFGVCCIDILRICSAGLISQMVPIRRSEGELRLVLSLLGKEGFQVVPLIDICATYMLDFAGTENRLTWFMARFSESCNVRDIHAEDIFWEVCDFFEAVEAWEECAPRGVNLCHWDLVIDLPEHMTSVFAIGNSMEAQIQLLFHN